MYDQIIAMGARTKSKRARRIMFPTLIQQVIHFQRTIPSDYPADEFTGFPKLVVKDIKAGRGTGADTRSASLAIRIRLRSKRILLLFDLLSSLT